MTSPFGHAHTVPLTLPGRMTTAHTADGALSPELEAIATAAHDRLDAQTGQDPSTIEEAERRVTEAARPPSPPARASARSPMRNAPATSAPAKSSAPTCYGR